MKIIIPFFSQKFHNATACQILGNLCTLALHARDHPACKVLHELIYRKRYEEVPRLFYDGEKQKIPINREDITTVYKLRETDTGMDKSFSLSIPSMLLTAICLQIIKLVPRKILEVTD